MILNINSSLTNWTTHYRIICPSPEAAMLMKRLESQVFHAMQTADSPLYEPGLAMLLVGKKKKQKQDQNNMPLQKRHLLFVVVVILTSIWNPLDTMSLHKQWLYGMIAVLGTSLTPSDLHEVCLVLLWPWPPNTYLIMPSILLRYWFLKCLPWEEPKKKKKTQGSEDEEEDEAQSGKGTGDDDDDANQEEDEEEDENDDMDLEGEDDEEEEGSNNGEDEEESNPEESVDLGDDEEERKGTKRKAAGKAKAKAKAKGRAKAKGKAKAKAKGSAAKAKGRPKAMVCFQLQFIIAIKFSDISWLVPRKQQYIS